MKAMASRKFFSNILGMENKFRPMRSFAPVAPSAEPAARSAAERERN